MQTTDVPFDTLQSLGVQTLCKYEFRVSISVNLFAKYGAAILWQVLRNRSALGIIMPGYWTENLSFIAVASPSHSFNSVINSK